MTSTDSFWWEHLRAGLAALVAVVMVAGLTVGAAPARAQAPPPNTPCPADTPRSGFVDRDQARSGHAESIDCVAFHAIAVGSTSPAGDPVYLPAGIVTRAQMATFIANALDAAGADLPDPDGADAFTDIADTVHRPRINALADAGVVSGFPDDSYRPNQPVTRAQMATFIVHAAEWALDTDLTAEAGPHFADTRGNTHEANIDAGFEAGLFAGRVAPEPDTPGSGVYAPRDGTRRDQMATFLARLLDYLWDVQGIAGLVTDATTGDVIPGAIVTVQPEPVDPEAEPILVNTDEHGLYHVPLEPGTYTVTAFADDYVEPDARTGVTVSQNEVTIVNFALQPFTPPTDPPPTDPPPTDPETGVLMGRVLQATTQIPLSDATVTVLDGDTEVAVADVEALGTYTAPLSPGTYTVTADAPGYLPSTKEAVSITAGSVSTRDFDLQLQPGAAVLTPDRELAPVSEIADPTVQSRGNVAFSLTAFDDEGDPVTPEGLAYTFGVVNDGDAPVEVCIYCGIDGDPREILTVDAGGVLVFDDVPGRHSIRVDADSPTSVRVTASTTVDGETRGASSGTGWTSVDISPTGQGQSVSLTGEVVAYDLDSNWYFFRTAGGSHVFVEYTGGATNSYLVGPLTVTLGQFEPTLGIGVQVNYMADEVNAQVHWVEPLG